jgi:hypothetical protein
MAHPMPMPQGPGDMQYNYSTYFSIWLDVTGYNSDQYSYGYFEVQLGASGDTNPCSGPCLTAIHTAKTGYNHAGGGYVYETVASTFLSFYPKYEQQWLQFLQQAPCWRAGTGDSWVCQAGIGGNASYNNWHYSTLSLDPPVGGANCTNHHP